MPNDEKNSNGNGPDSLSPRVPHHDMPSIPTIINIVIPLTAALVAAGVAHLMRAKRTTIAGAGVIAGLVVLATTQLATRIGFLEPSGPNDGASVTVDPQTDIRQYFGPGQEHETRQLELLRQNPDLPNDRKLATRVLLDSVTAMKPSLFKYLVDHDPSLITVSFDSDQYHGRLLNLLATTRTTWPLLEHILTKHKERAAEAVTLTGPDGKTPLYTAIENRQSMIAAACLETFPELARVPDATGTTPLQAAFALVERQSDPQQHLNGLLDLVAYMRILLEQAPETIPLSGVDHSMLDAARDALRRHSVDHPSLIESSRAFEVLDDFEAKCGSANERGDDAPARSCIITDSEGITAMSPFPGPLIPATLRHRHARRQPLRFSR